MHTILIRLQNVTDVEKLVSAVTCLNFPVYISDGNMTVDGTDFMELFCLNLTQPVSITAQCEEAELEQLIRDNGFRRVS